MTQGDASHAGDEVKALSKMIATIAEVLEIVTKKLAVQVEGLRAKDVGDSRVGVLAETLYIARWGEVELAKIGELLQQLEQSVQTSQSGISSLQREREMLASVYRVAQELSSTIDLKTVLSQVIDKVIEVFKADRGFLILHNETTHQFDYTIARTRDRRPIPESEDQKISKTLIREVWNSRKPKGNSDEDPNETMQRHHIRSFLCAPLLIQGRPIGIVYVDNLIHVTSYTSQDLDFLTVCCNQAAIAIDHARKVSEITNVRNLLNNVFRSIPSGVITLDPRGQIQLFTHAAERIFGLDAQRVLGRSYQQVFALLGQEKMIEVIERAKADDPAILNCEIECVLPKRGKVSLSINISPLRDNDNKETGIVMAVEDLTDLRALQNAIELLRPYIAPSVFEELRRNPEALKLQTKEVSILFADIRGFTALSDGRTPDEVVELLNAYLPILVEAIWQELGTITMFQGDAIMAIFNAPLNQPDHAMRAVRAALGMRRAIEERQKRPGSHSPEVKYGIKVHYGIGVSTGIATLGNIGPRNHLQNYTAIGDAVNVAARLQSNADNNAIFIHHTTFEQVKEGSVCLGPEKIVVKGKKEPLLFYKVLRMKETLAL